MGNKVFISYRRADPDQTIASFLETAFATAGLEVFRDVHTPVGARGAIGGSPTAEQFRNRNALCRESNPECSG